MKCTVVRGSRRTLEGLAERLCQGGDAVPAQRVTPRHLHLVPRLLLPGEEFESGHTICTVSTS